MKYWLLAALLILLTGCRTEPVVSDLKVRIEYDPLAEPQTSKLTVEYRLVK